MFLWFAFFHSVYRECLSRSERMGLPRSPVGGFLSVHDVVCLPGPL